MRSPLVYVVRDKKKRALFVALSERRAIEWKSDKPDTRLYEYELEV